MVVGCYASIFIPSLPFVFSFSPANGRFIQIALQDRFEQVQPRIGATRQGSELLSNLVFEVSGSCGDLVLVCGFNSIFERDASYDFGEVIKAA